MKPASTSWSTARSLNCPSGAALNSPQVGKKPTLSCGSTMVTASGRFPRVSSPRPRASTHSAMSQSLQVTRALPCSIRRRALCSGLTYTERRAARSKTATFSMVCAKPSTVTTKESGRSLLFPFARGPFPAVSGFLGESTNFCYSSSQKHSPALGAPATTPCGLLGVRSRMEASMEITVEHLGSVQFEIKTRGHSIISDQPLVDGGYDEGMTPPELLLASLGSCAAFYAAQYLRKHKLATEGARVYVSCEKVKDPVPRMSNFVIDVAPPVELVEEHRKGLYQAVEHCLVHNTLLHAPEISIQVGVALPAAK